MRIWIFCFMLVLLSDFPNPLVAQSAPPDMQSKVAMAVRTDVPPFVWKDEKTGHYQGFFWDICIAALPRAGYAEYEIFEISANDRKKLLERGDFENGDTDSQTIDLLCDPTTISLQRMAELESFSDKFSTRRFSFSPILYVANGSYVQQVYNVAEFGNRLKSRMKGDCDSASENFRRIFCEVDRPHYWWSWLFLPERPDPAMFRTPDWPALCKDINSILNANSETSEAEESDAEGSDKGAIWPPQIWPTPVFPEPQIEIWGYVRGTTLGQSVNRAAERAPRELGVCARELPSHQVAAQEFCKGQLFRYFGDVDIVRSAIASHRSLSLVTCPSNERPSTTGTYEPYAMLMASSEGKPDFPERFSAAIYSMFADGTIEQLFNGRFGSSRPSDALSTLFLINSIPTGVLEGD